MTESKIEDHQVHLIVIEIVTELNDHLLATTRHQGTDVVLPEIVDDHALQGRIILYDEDAYLAIPAVTKTAIS